ncbi:MAG: 5'-methylthioadenosine/S-adenosylhomocysteine nucleosidase, partial [Eubacteriales bacterium]|nr:5'-methylthioadenosine/S-adenosylhomocysteine nucleosidase [Eubacteriales bacterium]
AAAPDVAVFEGRVVSGDQFVCTRAQKEMIKAEVEGMCTEMEGAAIAQAAYLNEIPFVIVRAISDKADESVQVAYEEFEAKAAVDCAALVAEMLQTM